MNSMFNTVNNRMSIQMSEDVHAPELRNPQVGGLRKGRGWLARLLGGMKKA